MSEFRTIKKDKNNSIIFITDEGLEKFCFNLEGSMNTKASAEFIVKKLNSIINY